MQGWVSVLARRVGLLALLLPLLAAGVARADDDVAVTAEAKRKAYARRILVQRALESVRPDRLEEDGVARDRASLIEGGEDLKKIAAQEVKRADVLVGPEPHQGLIGDAVWLYDWMTRLEPRADQRSIEENTTRREARPVVVFANTTEQPDLEAFGPLPGGAEAPTEDPQELARRRGLAADREQRRTQATPDLILRSLDVLRRRENSLIAVEHTASLETALARAPRWAAAAGTADATLVTAHNIALTDRYELETAMSEAFLAAREVQVTLRRAAYAAESVPTGLVSERAVEEKKKRAADFHAEVARLEKRRSATDEALDWLAWAERELASDLGRLGSRLEEARVTLAAEEKAAAAAKAEAEAQAKAAAKAKAEAEAKEQAEAEGDEARDDPGADEKSSKSDGKSDKAGAPDKAEAKDAGDSGEPAEPDEPDAPEDEPEEAAPAEYTAAKRAYIRLQLEDGILKLKMTLLYLAVHRAVERGALYDRAIELGKEEAGAALTVAVRYEAELQRMRRERQLERLEYESAKLTMLHTDARDRSSDSTHENRELWILWDQALTALLDVNRFTQEAVELRRTFAAAIRPNQASAISTDDEESEDSTEGDAGGLRRFRHPDRAEFNAKYVTEARTALASPAFDSTLVALHHDVVLNRLEALSEALPLARGRARLDAQFAKAKGAADTALKGLRALAGALKDAGEGGYWKATVDETRAEDFDPTVRAFGETQRGLEDMLQTANELRDVCEGYESDLRRLGPRSFRIRVDRTLDGDGLEHAVTDVKSTLGSAARWVTGRSEENLGTFVQARWLMLLACLALAVGGVLFVRLARRGLDRVISGLARNVAELRAEVVTVRAEEAHAARERAQDEIDAKLTESEALRLVSKEEADKAQKMGEGGYGGGNE